jgi:hypothetical protein
MISLSDNEIARTVDVLNRDGACVLSGLLDSHLVQSLRTEIKELLRISAKGVTAEKHPGGPSIRLSIGSLDESAAPVILKTLCSASLRETAHQYDAGCIFCHDAVVTHDINPGGITDVHFDMQPSLKCMIYLSDVDRDSAAFRYAFGTHRRNRAFRHDFLRAGGSLGGLPNVPGPEEPVALTDLEGPAGTIILFDTDGFHSAGILAPKRQRLLIRSRTILNGWFNSTILRTMARLPINPWRLVPPTVPAGRQSTGGRGRAT